MHRRARCRTGRVERFARSIVPPYAAALAQQQADQRRQRVEQLRGRRDPIGERGGRRGCRWRSTPIAEALLERAAQVLRVPAVRRPPGRRRPARTRAKPLAAQAGPRSTSRSGAPRSASVPSAIRRRGCGRRSGARRAGSPSWRSRGVTCTSSQSPAGRRRPASTALMTLKVARSTMPACAPAAAQTSSYCLDDVAPRQHDDELTAARRPARRRARTADLRVLDRERRRLAHLPPDELVEVAAPARAPSRSRSSDTLATLSGTTSATRLGRPPIRVEHPSQGAADGPRRRGCSRRSAPGRTAPGGQRLDGVRRDGRLAAARLDARAADTRCRRSPPRPSAEAVRAAATAMRLIRRTSPC